MKYLLIILALLIIPIISAAECPPGLPPGTICEESSISIDTLEEIKPVQDPSQIPWTTMLLWVVFCLIIFYIGFKYFKKRNPIKKTKKKIQKKK
jgi:hypothetical protein